MSLATAHRVEVGVTGTWLVLPGFGAPHRFGTATFLTKAHRTIDGAPVITANQVHKDGVLSVDRHGEDWAAFQAVAAQTDADAVVTDRAECWAGVSTADCVPLLLHDPDRRVVAAVHAGWRGALMGVVPAALRRLIDRFASQPTAIEAAIGPHIGVCCFEVGRAVLDPLTTQFPGGQGWIERASGGKGYFNIRAFIRWQLAEAGLSADRVHAVDLCTRCETSVLSSYRREGRKPLGMLSAVRVPVEEMRGGG
jgi:YfiH family protein